jgi:uncharacterized delta-60 repeat protein
MRSDLREDASVTLRGLVAPVAAAALVLAGVAGAAPGDLDPSFGDGGIVTITFSDSDEAAALAVQPDGKIVVAGFARVQRSAIVRYNADGTLDPTFDGDGIVRPDLDFFPNALAVQADGKLVVAGLLYRRNGVFGLLRLNGDGSLDASFGRGGVAATPVGRQLSVPNALIVQADGKLVAAGYSWKKGTGSSGIALARLDTDGRLDRTFSGDGKLVTKMSREDARAEALALQADGKLVAAGWTGTPGISPVRLALARYHADGKLDNSFSGDGKLTMSIGGSADYARALVVQADGKLVAAGETSDRFALVRYGPDGTLDPSFGEDGIVITPLGLDSVAYALILQDDGKLVAAGAAKNPSTVELALARYDG